MPGTLALAMAAVSMLVGEHLRNESVADCAAVLKDLAARRTVTDPPRDDFSDCESIVRDFYELRDYAPAWTREGEPTIQALSVIHALESADAKGLSGIDYDAGLWASRVAKLLKNAVSPSEQDLAHFDLALTVSLSRYIGHVSLGKANPGIFLSTQEIQERRRELCSLLQRLTGATRVSQLLSSVEPQFPGYERTLTALRFYRAVAEKEDGHLMPTPRKPVESGGTYAELPRLVERLIRFGDLSPEAGSDGMGNRYEGALVDAVKRFQLRHGLEPDGVLGASTIAELNTSVRKRIRQLRLTLERYRWVPYKPGRAQIVVNIPEFRLRGLTETYGPEIELKVVVGRAYRHQTPVFWAEMKHVIFRPYWNVPRSIQRAELLPELRRDRGYLARNNYEILNSSDSVITRTTINDEILYQLEAGTLRIRQLPGDRNSLGLVKFVFPNDHNVYLHDTPATELFSRSRRDFSHGCIRVESPETLAAWVLRQSEGWTNERIREAMHGERTVQVNLEVSIPVLIVYATAIVLPNGEVRFFKDIYGHDAALERLLSQPTS